MKKNIFTTITTTVMAFIMVATMTTNAFANVVSDTILKGIQSGETSIDVSQLDLSANDIMDAFTSVYHTEPSAFRANSSIKMKTVANKITAVNVTYDLPATAQAELNSAVDKAIASVSSQATTLDKIKGIHDYMLNNCKVGTSGFTAYDSLVKGSSVCSGYALGFKAIMDKMGIPCEVVVSTPMHHEWNMVQLNGKWYHVDMMWDANFSEGGAIAYDNFLKSDSMMSALGHTGWTVDGNLSATDTTYDLGL